MQISKRDDEKGKLNTTYRQYVFLINTINFLIIKNKELIHLLLQTKNARRLVFKLAVIYIYFKKGK